jgi:hypothetical protein
MITRHDLVESEMFDDVRGASEEDSEDSQESEEAEEQVDAEVDAELHGRAKPNEGAPD